MRFFLWLLVAWPLLAASISNGQTFIVPFHKSYKFYMPHTNIGHLIIIPIPYDAKPATRWLRIDGKAVKLVIRRKQYPKEHLSVAPSKVHPPKSVQSRIAAEFKEAKRIYAHTTPKSYITRPFILPLKSTITDPFGVARLFNGKLASYHGGTDFRASLGTPVKAINDGVVVLAKMRYFAGGSIIIDHGRGVYSCYYHLSRFKVKPGDRVKRGQIIALSGQSGRVTGPHLHLTIKIKGISVDPMQFIDAFNQTFKTVSSLPLGLKR